jgi:hypothetical protein
MPIATRRKALQHPADDDQQRSDDADCRIGRRDGQQQNAERHQCNHQQ